MAACGIRGAGRHAKAGFVSTAEVNGEATTGRPFSEADHPSPEKPYGKSKWEAEQLLSEVGSRGRLETVVLRVPLVYGPRVKANFFVSAKIVRHAFAVAAWRDSRQQTKPALCR